jgi:hypothetical protein
MFRLKINPVLIHRAGHINKKIRLTPVKMPTIQPCHHSATENRQKDAAAIQPSASGRTQTNYNQAEFVYLENIGKYQRPVGKGCQMW